MDKKSGELFYVMGASGVGKDALLDALRQQAPADVHIACRYTTRPTPRPGPLEGGICGGDFERLETAGAFWFRWLSYGVCYAIRTREADRLRRGRHVIVNGSRAYLTIARARCPQLRPVLVTCDDEQELRRRLVERGREGCQAVEARIARGRALAAAVPADTAIIDNGGALAVALARLRQLIENG